MHSLPQVWVNAAAQNFNSIGIGFGSMITFSSYNKFSNNLLVDVWVIGLINACTSLLAGIIVFSTMGNIAFEQGRNITDVVAEGNSEQGRNITEVVTEGNYEQGENITDMVTDGNYDYCKNIFT